MSMTETIWGRLDTAEDLLAEGVQLHTVLARSSREFDIYRHPELAAWRGGERAPIDELIRVTSEAGTWMGHGAVVTVANIGRIILDLSCGEYTSAKEIAFERDRGRRLRDAHACAARVGRSGDPRRRHRRCRTRSRALAASEPQHQGLRSGWACWPDRRR